MVQTSYEIYLLVDTKFPYDYYLPIMTNKHVHYQLI